jgi:hypothetical protein
MEKKLPWLYLLFFIVTPIIFLVLPVDFFDTGASICPSKRFFNIECYGCGMTRAVMHLIHFDLESALYFNSLSVIVAPVLAIFWIKWTISAAKDVGIIQRKK